MPSSDEDDLYAELITEQEEKKKREEKEENQKTFQKLYQQIKNIKEENKILKEMGIKKEPSEERDHRDHRKEKRRPISPSSDFNRPSTSGHHHKPKKMKEPPREESPDRRRHGSPDKRRRASPSPESYRRSSKSSKKQSSGLYSTSLKSEIEKNTGVRLGPSPPRSPPRSSKKQKMHRSRSRESHHRRRRSSSPRRSDASSPIQQSSSRYIKQEPRSRSITPEYRQSVEEPLQEPPRVFTPAFDASSALSSSPTPSLQTVKRLMPKPISDDYRRLVILNPLLRQNLLGELPKETPKTSTANERGAHRPSSSSTAIEGTPEPSSRDEEHTPRPPSSAAIESSPTPRLEHTSRPSSHDKASSFKSSSRLEHTPRPPPSMGSAVLDDQPPKSSASIDFEEILRKIKREPSTEDPGDYSTRVAAIKLNIKKEPVEEESRPLLKNCSFSPPVRRTKEEEEEIEEHEIKTEIVEDPRLVQASYVNGNHTVVPPVELMLVKFTVDRSHLSFGPKIKRSKPKN